MAFDNVPESEAAFALGVGVITAAVVGIAVAIRPAAVCPTCGTTVPCPTCPGPADICNNYETN